MEQLLDLVIRAGHRGWRDARGPLGLTQRQANGRFTSDEAQALIDQLLEAEHQADLSIQMGQGDDGQVEAGPDPPPPVQRQNITPATTIARRRNEQARILRTVPVDLLAAELQRRGWVVVQP